MFTSLDRVDWALLHRQKRALVDLLDTLDRNAASAGALWGIVHLLDALQDDAAAAGRWTFPGEAAIPAGPPPLRRYYVEDDEGHHHGPLDDHESAADVADALHGRIIVQQLDRPVPPPDAADA